ncbi:hypothetical protein GN244_ATG03523 [Phytophthora infestans]|uniref:Uncharacterized protein n=1 Tax=Phytophthora infestans TaxID=4787 RepID=A0A833TP70_PHYIN|nr:hypothetical protein GN244_ATG03523 [Phytophthora infestans]
MGLTPSDSQSEGSDQASGSVYTPSSGSSSFGSQASIRPEGQLPLFRSAPSKRQYTMMPLEGEQIRQYVRSHQQIAMEAAAVESMQDIGQPDPPPASEITRDAWPKLWSSQSGVWDVPHGASFPVQESSEVDWIAAATADLEQLLRLLQQLPFPEEFSPPCVPGR